MQLPDMSASLAKQEEAKRLIPGMTQLLSKRPDMFSLGVWPGYFQRAQGGLVWDLDGNELLDVSIGGIGANTLGYCDPDVKAAVIAAVEAGTSCSLNCPEEVELARVLTELHPWADMARFARTGGEGLAVAIRIARASTGRDRVAFCGYHGWHDWYLAANLESPDNLNGHLLPGLSPVGVPKGLAGTALPFRYNHPEELQQLISAYGDELAAVIMEPIRGERPQEGFLEQVRELASGCGAVLIFDEVSAGFRLNTGGVHLTLDTEPDMAVLAKALGNGYPIAAVIGRGAVMDAAQRSFISSTYWTERIGPAAALAVIEKYQARDVPQRLIALGDAVQRGWRERADRHGVPIQIGGLEPMVHFGFQLEPALSAKALYIQTLLSQGILGTNLYYAMYAHTDEQIQRYLEGVDVAFAEVAEAMREGDWERRLIGEPTSPGFARLA